MSGTQILAIDVVTISEMLNQWVPSDEAQERLEKFYLLRWNAKHFRQENRFSIIIHQEVKYNVIIEPGSGFNPYKDRDGDVFLSFRKHPALDYGYVMVRRAHS